MRAIWRFVFPGLAVSILVLCGAALVRVAVAAPQGSGYHQVKKVTLGGDGRWDYFEVEPATHRVFIPRGTHVMVLDADCGKLLSDIKGLEGTHGIDFAPELKRAFTTNGDAKSVTILDTDTLKVIGEVKLPDREPERHHWYVTRLRSASLRSMKSQAPTQLRSTPKRGRS